MSENKEIFAKVYAEKFTQIYTGILPAEKIRPLIEKAIAAALNNIGAVDISGKAFQETFKELGIKPTYKSVREFLGQS